MEGLGRERKVEAQVEPRWVVTSHSVRFLNLGLDPDLDLPFSHDPRPARALSRIFPPLAAPALHATERANAQPRKPVTTTQPILDGIVLAAGQSQRMGRPKALLEVGTETFLEHALRVMREGGCRTLTLVLACKDARIEEIAQQYDARVLFNPDPESEQFASIQLALASLPEDSIAAAILPVDCPLVTAASIETLAEAAAKSKRPLVLPMYNGVGGHPLIVCRSYYAELLAAQPIEGMRTLIIDRGHQVEIVNLADPGVLIDIDTEQEYDRFIVNPE